MQANAIHQVIQMAAIEKGRVCVKKSGRDAGEKCVIVKVVNESFVEISNGKKVSKCSIRQLEPLSQLIDSGNEASLKAALSK